MKFTKNTTTRPADPVTGPMQSSRPWQAWLAWLGIAAVVLVADQLSKAWVLAHFSYGERLPVLPIFDLTLLFNPGAAFSLLAGAGGFQRWLFIGIALLVSIILLRWIFTHSAQAVLCLGLAAILGGALGNVADRLLHGHVLDFLLFYWNDWYFPAFNLADTAITCGAALLIADELLRWRRARRARQTDRQD